MESIANWVIIILLFLPYKLLDLLTTLFQECNFLFCPAQRESVHAHTSSEQQRLLVVGLNFGKNR